MQLRGVVRSFILAFLLAALIAGGPAAHGQHAPDVMMTASGSGHAWFVLRQNSTHQLCHFDREMAGRHYRVQRALAQPPAAIASHHDRVWIVFDARTGNGAKREVFTLQVKPNLAMGGYYSEPSNRLDSVASLPGNGTLTSLIGTSRGPLALLVPKAAGTAGPLAPAAADETSTASIDRPMLLQLRRDQWQEIALPDDFDPGRHAYLVNWGDDFAIITFVAGDPQQSSLHVYENDQWRHSTTPVDTRRIIAVTSCAGQIAAALRGESAPQLELAVLRPDARLHIASLEQSNAVAFGVFGFDSSIVLIEQLADGSLISREVEATSGKVSASRSVDVQPISAARLWRISVLVALAITALLLLFLLKPAHRADATLPQGWAPLPLTARMIAFAIDLLPGAVLTMLMLKVQVRDLFAITILSSTLQEGLPYLLMIGLTVAHSTIAECIRGKTIGKAIMGAANFRLDGQRPGIGQSLMRNVVKLFVLLIPPLAAFAILNPQLRGLHDFAAGTVVAHEAAAEERKP